MSTKTKKRLEKIQSLLERLEKRSTKGTPIVVEGKKDLQALQRLGITGEFVLAKNAGKSFLDVVNEIENMKKREVILLFDFDRRGKEWTNRMSRYLEELKIVPILLFWRTLSGLVGRDIKDIEGLVSFLDTLTKRTVKS